MMENEFGPDKETTRKIFVNNLDIRTEYSKFGPAAQQYTGTDSYLEEHATRIV